MKVYLLTPPFVPRYSRSSRWAARCRGGALYYPIWLSYATGALEQSGHKVRLMDAPARGWDLTTVRADVEAFGPGVVVTETNFQSLTPDLTAAQITSETAKALSVVTGPPATHLARRMLAHQGVEVVLRGEYDLTLRDLISALERGNSVDSVSGITHVQNGEVVHTPDREPSSAASLDALPFVSRVYKQHLNVNDYFLSHTLYPMVQIFAGRGCPNRCTFCSWPSTLTGRKYRHRSVSSVVDEFEYVTNELSHVKEIFIEDDTFTIDTRWVHKICDEITRRRLALTWSCNARVTLDYETMQHMKQAGCRLLDVGYESGSDSMLTSMRKGITTTQSREFTANAKRAGLIILADFIIGLPGESTGTIEQTLAFAKELKPHLVQFAVATPIPGTEFYDWACANGCLETDDLEASLDPHGFQRCIVSYPALQAQEIEAAVKKGLRDYYLRPMYVPIALHYVMRKNGARELANLVRSGKAFLTYLRSEP